MSAVDHIFLCLFTGNDSANEETPNSLRLILRGSPGREFLSDAPFFGLSLWTEFKLALCACVSGWSSTLEPRSKLGDGSIWSIQL